MNPIPPSNGSIPSNLSERTFRTYEPFITQGVLAFPKETKFDPNVIGVSGNTFAARMRDSIVSLKRFKWETMVDCQRLWDITGQFVIAQDKDGVWFRGKGQRGRPSNLTSEARERNPAIDADVVRTPWKDTTYEEQRALCVLLHSGRLVGPFVLTGLVPERDITDWETEYNVAFVVDTERNLTIVT